jgi:hypothetical protein
LLAPLPSEATSDWHKLAAHWPALTMTTGPVQLSPDPETSALNFAGAPSRPPQGDAISIWSGSKARNVANRSSPSSRHQRNIDNEVRLYPPRAVGSSFRRCGPVWGRHRLMRSLRSRGCRCRQLQVVRGHHQDRQRYRRESAAFVGHGERTGRTEDIEANSAWTARHGRSQVAWR